MKIIFNISSLGKGGAERVVSILANKLVKDNEVLIILNTTKNLSYVLEQKIKIIELDNKIIKNPIIKNFKRIKKITKIIKKENPNIIISFLPMPSFKVLFANRKTRVPVIVADRNDPKQEYKGIIEKILMNWLYPKADGFVFQTNEQKRYFKKEIQEQSKIIFNPIKEEFLLQEQSFSNNKENTIIAVGRLVEQKNHKLLIKVFSNIAKEHKDYKLKIFGEGILKNELQEQINQLELKDKIILCDVTKDIKQELLKAKIFALTSIYEGMPNALMEAMAVGLPVVSTDCPCGGPKELIKDGVNGLLVPVNSEDVFTEKLKFLIENENIAEEMGQKAKDSMKILNPDNIIEQWEKYIKTIIKNKE